MPSEVIFKPNKKFAEIYFTDNRIIDIFGGRGRGGSHAITELALFHIINTKYFRCYFVRQTFNDIRDSLFRDFKDRISEHEDLDPADFKIDENSMRILYKPTGNIIVSKGVAKDGKRTAKMKSLAGATHVIIEEADELGQDDFDQLDLSLRTIKSEKVQIIRCFNPPSKSHWIWRDYNFEEIKIIENGKENIYFKPTVKTNADIFSVHGTYLDNVRNLQKSTIAKLESFKEKDFEYYCNQVLGLVSEGAKGRIFSGWKIIKDNDYNKIDLPCFYSIDFGYSNDPTAVLETKYEKQIRYRKEILYENGLDNTQLALRMRALGITDKHFIFADPGAGGDLRIAELRRGFPGIKDGDRLNFNIHPTIKGHGSINVGINKVKACENYVTENSSNIWNEYHNYKWALDLDKNPTEIPIDKYNHLMDCFRYFELSKNRYF